MPGWPRRSCRAVLTPAMRAAAITDPLETCCRGCSIPPGVPGPLDLVQADAQVLRHPQLGRLRPGPVADGPADDADPVVVGAASLSHAGVAEDGDLQVGVAAAPPGLPEGLLLQVSPAGPQDGEGDALLEVVEGAVDVVGLSLRVREDRQVRRPVGQRSLLKHQRHRGGLPAGSQRECGDLQGSPPPTPGRRPGGTGRSRPPSPGAARPPAPRKAAALPAGLRPPPGPRSAPPPGSAAPAPGGPA